MNKTVFFALVFLAALQTVGFSQKRGEGKSDRADTVVTDTAEYSLIVLDPGFETWLAGRPQMNFYSNDYYRDRNLFLVSEWNLRYITGNKDLYETFIDYSPFIDYGIEFNYRLFYYFKYFEETNHIRLLPYFR